MHEIIDGRGFVECGVVHALVCTMVGMNKRRADVQPVVRLKLLLGARQQPRDATHLAGHVVRAKEGYRMPIEYVIALSGKYRVQQRHAFGAGESAPQRATPATARIPVPVPSETDR